MKKISLLFTALFLSVFLFAQDQTTFILVRHAEKANDGTKDPPLNEAGAQRAIDLASLLENQQITALYSTPFKRTRETLQPLASNMELQTQDYDPFAKGDWLAELYESHKGGTVVIAGHSNTIPNLANLLLGNEMFSQFDDSEYFNLLVIVGNEVGKGKLVRLKF